MATPPTILRVAVPRPLYQCLDYLPIKGDSAQPGCRVRVPFGPTELTGIVIDIIDKSDFGTLKPIIETLDAEPLLDSPTLKLLLWASQYYHHPVGDVVVHALPLALRGQRKIPQTPIWKQCEIVDSEALQALQRSPKQQLVFKAIAEQQQGLNSTCLQRQFGEGITTLLRALAKKNLIETQQSAFYFPCAAPNPVASPAPRITLTQEQQSCVAQIKSAQPYLLHGVTGSGKTEVYLHAIEPHLDNNQQILMLVPEIGLTPQLLARFTGYFPKHCIVVMHSGLASGERMKAWLAAQTGQLDILIGTRSAVFAPMPRLGMMIVDEEHDSSLKQQEGFRYHARDIAIKRAHDLKIPVILGSATPSFESLHNADRQRYHYLSLKQRPGATVQPDILVQDIRGLTLESGVCLPLMDRARQHIDAGNQVMFFLNRRGFAPAFLCPQCGWHAQCSGCEANMTYHAQAQKLICHRCDFEVAAYTRCPECNNPHITTKGQGTERIEQKLQSHFPDTQIIRVDRDTTRRKDELKKKLELVNQGKPAILVGTQMLAKGHDFPNLTLVGILDIDQSLFSTDFRAGERLSQLILQVAGRAGRATKKGTVVLQTSQPGHPFIHTLLSQGYLAIARQLLEERKNWYFPPYAYQALIRANAPKQENAINFLKQVKALLVRYESNDFILLGPAPSPIEKRANRYRAQLLITATQRKQLHQVLGSMTNQVGTIRKTGGVRWSVDVDAIDYA